MDNSATAIVINSMRYWSVKLKSVQVVMYFLLIDPCAHNVIVYSEQ